MSEYESDNWNEIEPPAPDFDGESNPESVQEDRWGNRSGQDENQGRVFAGRPWLVALVSDWGSDLTSELATDPDNESVGLAAEDLRAVYEAMYERGHIDILDWEDEDCQAGFGFTALTTDLPPGDPQRQEIEFALTTRALLSAARGRGWPRPFVRAGGLYDLDDLVERIDDGRREAVHRDLAPCDSQVWAEEYFRRWPEDAAILDELPELEI